MATTMNGQVIMETSKLIVYALENLTFCKSMVKAIKEITPQAHTYKTLREFNRTTVLIYDKSGNRIGHVEPVIKNGFQSSSSYAVKK